MQALRRARLSRRPASSCRDRRTKACRRTAASRASCCPPERQPMLRARAARCAAPGSSGTCARSARARPIFSRRRPRTRVSASPPPGSSPTGCAPIAISRAPSLRSRRSASMPNPCARGPRKAGAHRARASSASALSRHRDRTTGPRSCASCAAPGRCPASRPAKGCASRIPTPATPTIPSSTRMRCVPTSATTSSTTIPTRSTRSTA
jgi:hypothetical protein